MDRDRFLKSTEIYKEIQRTGEIISKLSNVQTRPYIKFFDREALDCLGTRVNANDEIEIIDESLRGVMINCYKERLDKLNKEFDLI